MMTIADRVMLFFILAVFVFCVFDWFHSDIVDEFFESVGMFCGCLFKLILIIVCVVIAWHFFSWIGATGTLIILLLLLL